MRVITAESPVKTTEFRAPLYRKQTLSASNNVELYYRILQVHVHLTPLLTDSVYFNIVLSDQLNNSVATVAV